MTNKKTSQPRRHAEVENFEIGGIRWRIGPSFLITYAEHYLLAAKSTQAPANAPNFPLVRTFLACRAVELALKAFLSLKGGSSLLRLAGGPFGHDLENLIDEAEKLNLQSLIKLKDKHREEIIRASIYYREKVLEYPALMEAVRAYPQMPNADALIAAGEALTSRLREPCLFA